jgi:putative DNA primase/helicase
VRAADLLAAEAPSEELSSQDEALTFLLEILDGGPLPAREILGAAKQAGISERTLRRVKSREGIRATKVRYGDGAEWVWSIRSTSRSLPRLP